MKWLAATIVFAMTLCGAYLGLRQQALVSYLLAGFIMGWVLVGLLCVVAWLARKFREKTPRFALWVGNIFLALSSAAAVFCVGSAVYAAYEGASLQLVGQLVGIGVFYLVVGCGVRCALGSKWWSTS
jgi:hypothetical protein